MTQSLDLTPFLLRLDELEAVGRDTGTEGMARTVAASGARGEPLLMGRDPISRYLCKILPSDCRVSCTLDFVTVDQGPPNSTRTVAHWSLAAYPYIQALLSMIEDLYFPELWARA